MLEEPERKFIFADSVEYQTNVALLVKYYFIRLKDTNIQIVNSRPTVRSLDGFLHKLPMPDTLPCTGVLMIYLFVHWRSCTKQDVTENKT